MTFNDLEWPFHSSSVPPVWEGCVLKELNANVNALCTMSTLKSTSSALHAISAVAEFLVLVDCLLCVKRGIKAAKILVAAFVKRFPV